MDRYVLLEPQVCVLSTLVGSMNRNLDLNLRFCLGLLLFENTSSTTWSADCLNLNWKVKLGFGQFWKKPPPPHGALGPFASQVPVCTVWYTLPSPIAELTSFKTNLKEYVLTATYKRSSRKNPRENVDKKEPQRMLWRQLTKDFWRHTSSPPRCSRRQLASQT